MLWNFIFRENPHFIGIKQVDCSQRFAFSFLSFQQIANGLLMGTAAAIGLLCYYLGEAKQRRAFLEAKKSLEVKMVIEEQSAEQVKT